MKGAAIRSLAFFTRHLLFVSFVMFTGCILWSVAYFLLFLAAVVFDKGLGSPAAFPVGLGAIIVPCIIVGLGIFAPACAVGAVFCAALRLPRLAAIPIVALAAYVLQSLFYWGYIELVTTHPMPSLQASLRYFFVFVSIPLGIYWWLTEGPGALFDAFRRWLQSRSQKKLGKGEGDA